MDNVSSKQNKWNKFVEIFTPPPRWKLPVIIILGIFFGLGLTILKLSNALSYLSDDPNACVNCHIMSPQYATWQSGAHGRVTTCNDCHVPHDNVFSKYYFKAKDGMRHATMFTFRLEPQVIVIKDAGKSVVQSNCIRCHSNLVHPISLRGINNKIILDEDNRYCWDCHRETPHGRVNSLSSTPYARVPRLTPVLPEWLYNAIKKEK